ncbi:HlyD family secretion protein [Cyclonatronum proteinivorum]|uniref:HlyD family secretion protein n=1 Tax=Cyclonatronum proteinivorum TaxID=1457365 RepID=A0A345UL36_9BACT|nr:biotin/lipoyl-binding protein [Cyclonatronum proteinivorum]AXJ01188.1 HlyD family secretion protein [Cyclonatronum proteinivorum]
MKDLKLLALIGAVSLLLMAVIAWFAIQQRAQPLQPGYPARVVAETLHFTTKVPGRVLEVHAHEGQLMPAGSLLMTLDFPELEAKISQAEGAVGAAQAQYELALNGPSAFDTGRARASLEAAEAQYQLAKRSLDRISALYSDSLIAAQDFDEMQARYQAAAAQKQAAALLFEDLMAGTRQEKISMAQGDLQRTEATLHELRGLYEERFIRTADAVHIESVNLRRGELAPQGYTLISGYLPDQVYIRLSVPESELSHFQEGVSIHGKISANGAEGQFRVLSRRVLPGYAVRSAAFPNSSFEEQWFEIRMRPDTALLEQLPGNGAQVILYPEGEDA